MIPSLVSTDVLDPDQVDLVLGLVERVRARDGVAPLNEAALLAITSSAPDRAYAHLLAVDEPGTLVGYLFADLHGEHRAQLELGVDPDHRRQGIATLLLESFLVPRPDDAEVSAWAHGDLPGASTLASEHGLEPVRTLLELALDVDGPLPSPSPPDGVTIRTFVPGQDDAAWLAVNAKAFASHPEQGTTTQHDLDQRIGSSWFDPAGFFLAEQDGELVGFHWTKVQDGEGEVYVVGVAPTAQGLGLGSLLTGTGLHYLSARGLRRITLYVEADNAPALAVYQRLGFVEEARDVLYRLGG